MSLESLNRRQALDEAARLMREALQHLAQGGEERKTARLVAQAHNLLLSVGACREDDPAAEDRLDLAELKRLDTPSARRLLEGLQETRALAEAVDAERSQVLPQPIPTYSGGQPLRGLGWAQRLAVLEMQMNAEIYGALGSLEKGSLT